MGELPTAQKINDSFRDRVSYCAPRDKSPPYVTPVKSKLYHVCINLGNTLTDLVMKDRTSCLSPSAHDPPWWKWE